MNFIPQVRQFPYKSKLSASNSLRYSDSSGPRDGGGRGISNDPELEGKRKVVSESEERREVARSDKIKLMKSLAEYHPT